MSYIAKIFDYARADFPGIKLALSDARPLLKCNGHSDDYYKAIYEFNDMCKEYCKAHPDCTLIENAKAEMFFEEGCVGDYSKICPDYFIEDKVHMTKEGYDKYAEFYGEALKNFL